MECGERLARRTPRNWRALFHTWTRAAWCDDCARRLGRFGFAGAARTIASISLVAVSAFSFGRFLRPAPPPLIISRATNSPLSDFPVNVEEATRASTGKDNESSRLDGSASDQPGADEKGYICGARTKKGAPCRRRVHAAGERCFQHKGLTAMVPLEKLEVKSK